MSAYPSESLGRLADELGEGAVTVEGLAERMQGKGLALLLVILGVCALVPSPGIPIGIPAGIMLGLLSLQMILGARELRLPGWLARRRVEASRVGNLLRRAVPTVRWMERRLRPQRMSHLTEAGWLRLLGVLVLLHGVLIALPIPLGNTLPGLSVILFGMGLLARDGLAVVAGLLMSLVAALFDALMVGAAVWFLDWLAR